MGSLYRLRNSRDEQWSAGIATGVFTSFAHLCCDVVGGGSVIKVIIIEDMGRVITDNR